MKIGFRKISPDLALKHIIFEVNGERHTITFKFSHRKGISDVVFDCREAKIIDAYPALLDLLKMLPPIIWLEIRFAFENLIGFFTK